MIEKILNKRNTVIFMLAVTAWRIFLNATMELHPDEAYYWMWSKHLQLSYFDHPPMIAYFIKLTTMFSSSEVFVRFSGIIVSLVMSYIIWALSRQLFKEEKIAAAGVLLLNAYPLTMSGTVIITPDIPAFLFWALGVFFAWQIFRTQKPYYWYLLALVFGLSLLSKYTAVFLAPCILLFMLLTDEKKWLKTIHPYLCAVLSAAIFAPVLIWNMQNYWISFKFQAGHGLSGYDSFGGILEYLGGQLLVLSPFAWLIGIWAAMLFCFSRSREKLFLGLTSFPIIVFFCLTSFKHAAAPNWPVLAYFTFTMALSAYFLDGTKWKQYLWAFVFGFSLFLSLLATAHARFSVIPLEKLSKEWARTDATNWFYGWEALAKKVRQYPGTKTILAPSHTLAATIDYYLNSKKETAKAFADPNIGRFSQYNLWKLPLSGGEKAMYVSMEGEALDAYRLYFEEPVITEVITVKRGDFPVRRFRIIYGKTKKNVPK